MNTEKFIVIHCNRESELFLLIQEFADLYYEAEFVSEINVYRSNTYANEYIINFTQLPEFDSFNYAVNYLSYSKNLDEDFDALGYFKISEDDQLDKKYHNKNVMVYFSKKHGEGDDVHGVFEDSLKTIRFGFAHGEHFSIQLFKERDYKVFELKPTAYTFVRAVHPNPDLEKQETRKGCLSFLGLF